MRKICLKDNLTPPDNYAWSVVYEEVDPGNTMYIRAVIKDQLANYNVSEFCLNNQNSPSIPPLTASLEDLGEVFPTSSYYQLNFHPVVSFSNWDRPDFGDTSVYFGWTYVNTNPAHAMSIPDVIQSYLGLKVRADGLLKLTPDDHYHHIPRYLFPTIPTSIITGMGFSGNNTSDDGLFMTFFQYENAVGTPVPYNMVNKHIPHSVDHFRPTGINNKIKNEALISTYPNPFDRSFSLIDSQRDNKTYHLQVMDILGRPVYSITDKLSSLNTSLSSETLNWSPGMYLLQLTDQENNQSQQIKIMKK